MGGVKVKNGLGKFLKRLGDKDTRKFNGVVEMVGEVGVETAEREYSNTSTRPNNIRVETRDNQVEIVAEGEHLAFAEFGTGIRGDGSYDKEKLPTQTLIFNSRGQEQRTQGWEYNYYKEQNKNINPNIPDFTGIVAQAQMLKTANDLQQELATKVAKKFKKGD